jgi:hypothetical protein
MRSTIHTLINDLSKKQLALFKNNLSWYTSQNLRLYQTLRNVSEVAYSAKYADHSNKTLRYNGQTYLVTLVDHEQVLPPIHNSISESDGYAPLNSSRIMECTGGELIIGRINWPY